VTQYSVLGQLRLMADLDNDRAMEALPLCAAAVEQLLPRLKPGVHRGDPRLDRAAAASALCMLRMRDESGGVESFKDGDISVSRRGGGAAAQAAREREAAFADIAELLRDTGFQAKTTRVH
jgi:hypothetical protein